ncbi:MAG: beta-ketoacyl-[acyl-carrier-protein] synthase II [Rhizobiales bacterium TMED168]|nr:MAG: beta-ketoacyl-[acyl-carrier-protein] synthase II [Rhizobiales bacterium TMED168]
MRRVVITGLGAVTPLGGDLNSSWKNLISSKSGATSISRFDATGFPCTIACEVPLGNGQDANDGTFNANDWVSSKDQKKIDTFILYGIAAAEMALKDSGWSPKTSEDSFRSGVGIGSGIGGLASIEKTSILLKERGPRRVSPFFIPGALINLAAGQISIRNNFKGPNLAAVTACASGSHSIGDGAQMIKSDKADVMLVGGAEAAICPIGMAGFSASRALSTNFNENPEKASRPYDSDRDGFVMGEGAGFLVLEELEHALSRDAKIYGELRGYGVSGDAFHITSPSEDGDGAFRSILMAIEDSGLNKEEINYINAHGTSTPLGDEIELKAVERAFQGQVDNLSMSSTKSSTGHLLGAAGAIEAVFSIMTLNENIIPPTINLDNPSIETKIDLIPHYSKKKEIQSVLSNSFGFGGTNASLIFSRHYN